MNGYCLGNLKTLYTCFTDTYTLFWQMGVICGKSYNALLIWHLATKQNKEETRQKRQSNP